MAQSKTINTNAKKQIGKALALLLTAVSLFTMSAAPALAVPAESDSGSWTLEVDVTGNFEFDPCADFVPDSAPASWSPDPVVNYYDGGNDETVSVDDGWVAFEVDVNFSPGFYTVCLDDPLVLNPEGSVVSSFVAIDSDIYAAADCDLDCPALGLYQDGSLIRGVIDVTSSEAPGTRTGTLTVTWTPAD